MTTGNGVPGSTTIGIDPTGNWEPRHAATWAIRRVKGTTPDEIGRSLFNYVWQQEALSGACFLKALPEKRLLLFSGRSHRAYELSSQNTELLGYLFEHYGILQSEGCTRHVIDGLKAYCAARGAEREVRRWCYYSTHDQLLYVSRYDGTMWRIDGATLDIVNNGDGILFADDDGGRAGADAGDIGPNNVLLSTLVDGLQYVETTAGGVSAASQQLALSIWLFAVAFPDLLPTKPMLLVEGDRGSGKSLSVQLISRAIHGKSHTCIVGEQDEKDFGVQLLRKPICLLDNTDSFVKWMQNALCSYATNGEWTKRKLYSDDNEYVLRPHSFIAIASMNPVTFERPDVADRCLILRLERRAQNVPSAVLIDQVEFARPQLLGEWLYYLHLIVGAIRAGRLAEVGQHSQTAAFHRMADFAFLAHVIGGVLGYGTEDVDLMLDGVQAERDVLAQTHDPLHDLLDRWIENESNIGRQVRASELHSELASIAVVTHRTYYRNPSTLIMKMRAPGLAKFFTIRATLVDGFNSYEIWRVEE